MVTFFNVRKGRDTVFKRGMRHFFSKRAKEYEARHGIRFIGWFNVTEGSEWNNVIIFDLPNYAVLDELYKDPGMRHRSHGGRCLTRSNDLPRPDVPTCVQL
jgi:hypothetical protein